MRLPGAFFKAPLFSIIPILRVLCYTTNTMFGLFSNKQPHSEAQKVPLRLYNTETGTIDHFTPLSPKKVTMYSCGPTVYDFAHIGNLRSYVFADILKRTLTYNGYKVENTINLTDFGHLSDDADTGEDKMMKGLKREGLPVTLASMRKLSDEYIEKFKEDIEELRIVEPSHWSRASDYVKEQIRLIETLEEKGYTYETSDGVYFDISKFPEYGRLGKIDISALRSGARVEVSSEKKHPADFAVWKKGLLGWDSAWGKGFPGWHIECSAMAFATLGKQIDIHTGGIDHISTHHNAEIAQSEAVTKKKFVQFWMHNAFITIDNTKIAKSLGNSITMRHLIEHGFTGDDYRYWLLTAHYRSHANFSFEALKAAKQALYRLKRHVYEEYKNKASAPVPEYVERFHQAINDDLDTPKVIALAWEVVKDDNLAAPEKCSTLKHFDQILEIGLDDDPDDAVRELGVIDVDSLPADILELIDKREAARVARNWEEADILREAINLKGFAVEDTPSGQKITRSK